MKMPKFFEQLLETELFGRLIRKVLWLAKESTLQLAIWMTQVFELHPYVRKLNRGHITGRVKVLRQYFDLLADSLERMPNRPCFTVLIMDDGLPDFPLAEIEKSLELQLDRNFDVIVGLILAGKTFELPPEKSSGHFVVFLGRYQRLLPQTLAEISRFSTLSPGMQIIYTDEMCLENNSVFYKPAWSPLLFLANQYVGKTIFFSRKLIIENGFGLIISASFAH